MVTTVGKVEELIGSNVDCPSDSDFWKQKAFETGQELALRIGAIVIYKKVEKLRNDHTWKQVYESLSESL